MAEGGGVKRISIILVSVILISVLIAGALCFLGRIGNVICSKPLPSCRCSLNLSLDKDSLVLLDELRVKRLEGLEISREEYQQAETSLIFEINPEDFGNYYNGGTKLGDFSYVRNDLPDEAEKFVRRHELEHLLTGNPSEFLANFAAFREYPLGLIETVLFSLQKRAEYYDNPFCFLLVIWREFKNGLLSPSAKLGIF